MYMRICTYIYSKGSYTLKMSVIITAILAQWQRSSPFTVETGVRDLETRKAFLHHFEYLFAIEIPERPSSPALSFPSRAWDARRNEKSLYTYIYIHILQIGVCICMYIVIKSLFMDVYKRIIMYINVYACILKYIPEYTYMYVYVCICI